MEILFKAQSADKKEWVKGIPLSYGDGVFIFTDGISMKAGENMFAKSKEVIPETICQFIWCYAGKDKIFEGDTIHAYGGAYEQGMWEYDEYETVPRMSEIEKFREFIEWFENWSNLANFQIVGNIHD